MTTLLGALFYFAASYVVSWVTNNYLFPPSTPPGAPTPDLQLTQNEIGTVIPEVLGTSQLNGTLLFFGNEWYKKRGKSGGKVPRKWYYMTWGVGYCAGPIDTLYTIFLDEKVIWNGELNLPASGGKETITPILGFTCNMNRLQGEVVVFFGTQDQAIELAGTESYLAVNGVIPDGTLDTPYRGLFWILFKDCILGIDQKRMPSMRVVVRKTPELPFNNNHIIDKYDYNPIHALWYILEKLVCLPSTWLDSVSFSSTADTIGGNIGDSWVIVADVSPHHTASNLCEFNEKLYFGSYTDGKLYEWDGDETWVAVADSISVDGGIWTLCVFNGKLYGGTQEYSGNGGRLLEWNGVDTWVVVAPDFTGDPYANSFANCLCVFDGELYNGTRSRCLLKWNGVDAWIKVAQATSDLNEIYSMCNYNGNLYIGSGIPAQLWMLSGGSLIKVAPQLSNYSYIYSLIVYNDKLYGSCRSGQLLEWNGVDAWVLVAPAYEYRETGCVQKVIFRDKLYRGEITGYLLEWNGVDAWIKVAPSIGDTNVTSLILYDSTIFGIANTGELKKFNYSEGMGISLVVRDYKTANNYISNVLRHIDCIMTYQVDGKFHPKLIRDDYSVDNLPLIDENVLVEKPSFRRKSWTDTLNEIKSNYSLLDRDASIINLRASSSDPVAFDTGNYGVQRRIVTKTLDFSLFTKNKYAVWASKNALQKVSYPFAILELTVNRPSFQLTPGDCFKFSSVDNGVSNMVCRVLSITEEGLNSEKIIIQAAEDFFSTSSTITEYSDPSPPSEEEVDYTIIQFTNQEVIELPYDMVTDASIIHVLPIAGAESDLDVGFEFNISSDGGASYLMFDAIENITPYGVLVQAYSEDTLTIDNEYGIIVDFLHGENQIEDASFSQTLNGSINVALLGDEIIFFETMTLISGSRFKINNVIRGRMGTEKQSHEENSVFYFLGDSPETITHSTFISGVGQDFKMVPYNELLYGDINDATNININFEGKAETPYPPVNLTANGEILTPGYTSDIVLEWSPRMRGLGAGTGIPGVILPTGEHEGYFEVEIWVSDVLMRTTTDVDSDTWTYTSAMNITDNGSLADVVVCKVLNYRTVNETTYESSQVQITCIKE